MEQGIISRKTADLRAELVTLAMRETGHVLGALLAAHLVIWTLPPFFLCRNLQVDLDEGLALGKEWQLGYWKHPPLPWWPAELSYPGPGSVDTHYLFGPPLSGIWLQPHWE